MIYAYGPSRTKNQPRSGHDRFKLGYSLVFKDSQKKLGLRPHPSLGNRNRITPLIFSLKEKTRESTEEELNIRKLRF